MTIPVILDTDIGFDVDDVWALAFMLKCPELDVRLITTNTGDTHYSARLVAKMLTLAGRSDIPVGIGIPIDTVPRTHAKWLGSYQLEDYAGDVHTDGVGAMLDVIKTSREKVVVIGIGPLSNISAALMRDVSMTENSRFIGMHGSIRKGYLGAPKPMKEYNVKTHAAACQKVFTTPWDLSITPLDTCGMITLSGDNFLRVANNDNPLTRAVLENHYDWFEAVKDWPVLSDMNPAAQSSILYDTVAVYMAFSEELLAMESLPILITDDGKSMISDGAQTVRCAMAWKDQDAFENLLVERLIS
ncbi:MAG: inosine-uridine nucleoside N-ribohydrolase [Candidatus Azotimanducaceae bacterium]|jgi:inosine-uridine nucleoside N-ribohydrolase